MKGRKSWAMAYCGMAAALSIAFMLLGAVIPILMYIAPAIASFLVATVCVECGKTLAWTAYGAVSLLSLLFVPDKEVALTFVFLLGYYPLVKPKFEHIRPALLRGLCKLLLCNGGILLMYVTPPVHENTEYYYFTNKPESFVLFKADGDQDRPNLK